MAGANVFAPLYGGLRLAIRHGVADDIAEYLTAASGGRNGQGRRVT